jgi:hypothetical protein
VLVRIGSNGQNLLLWTYVQGGSLDKVNQWNKEKRFSRAYLDGDGDANVEWDIDLEGGVTMGAVREGIRTFQTVVQIFKDTDLDADCRWQLVAGAPDGAPAAWVMRCGTRRRRPLPHHR